MAKEAALARLPMPAKIGVTLGLLTLSALAYWVIFYGDISSQIEHAVSQEKKLRVDLATAQRAEAEYHKDLEELEQRQQRQRDLNKILPKETEYPAFLSSIQSVASVTGVSLSAWTPQGEVEEQYYARIPMKLEVKGRYHQIAKFFYGVGQLERIINMENISITEPRKHDDEVLVSVSALATAFRVLPERSKSQDRKGRARRGKGT